MRPIYAYDSADYAGIPSHAQAIFPYADGKYAWNEVARERFPHAYRRNITCIEGNWEIASIIDVEPGCIWPPDDGRLRTFVENRWRAHRDATVYCNRDTVPLVRQALQGLSWKLGLATLDGTQPEAYQGLHCSYVQFYNQPEQLYDLNIVYDVQWVKKEPEPPDWWNS